MIRENNATPDRDRLLDLMAEQAVFGLTDDEQRELKRLQNEFPDIGADEMAQLATLLELSTLPDDSTYPAMSASLQDRLREDAQRFHLSSVESQNASTQPASPLATPKKPLANPDITTKSKEPIDAEVTSRPAIARRNVIRELGGWIVAAACLAIAAFTFYQPAGPPELTLVQSRAAFSAPDVVSVDWQATEDVYALDASGDVVWSDSQQEGFMRFVGLPVNDPTVEQYQLWIFDAEQDDQYPIDGGVFDIASNGETIVRIDPKINVTKATMFAVTIEKPGGVVVSSRERLPLLAKVP